MSDDRPSLLRLVDRRLAEAPADAGITCDGRFDPWSAVDAQAWRIAHRLRAGGVRRGDVVPVIAGRGAGLVAAWLGVLRAGAAYLPIDIDSPARRIAQLVAHAGARLALTNAAGAPGARAARLSVPLLDLDDAGAQVPGDETPVPISGQDAACLIYTSGSTGEPKGVLIDHDGLLQTALRWSWLEQLKPGDRLLCAVSVAFDVATMELSAALITGAALVLASDAQRRDPALLADLLRVPPTPAVLTLTPSAMDVCVAAMHDRPAGRRVSIVVGGEQLSAGQAARYAEVLGDVTNVWGTTETASFTTAVAVRPDDAAPPGIGTPIPGVRVYLLGPHLETVPDGAAGELCIAGAGVGIGYLGRPALTARRFVPDPWASGPGSRMYRTGDLGVRREDGSLQFIGRIDEQVKVRGHRIEPGEVEAVLRRGAGVRAAAVVPDGAGHLVAYLDVDPQSEPDRGSLLTTARQWLPAAVIPAEMYVVDRVPLTANGKVDRAALGELTRRPLRGSGSDAMPPDPSIRRAAGLFAAALDLPDGVVNGAGDDFFGLGGDSMQAARLVAELPEVALRDFLADPTVGGLGRLLAAGGKADGAPSPTGGVGGPDGVPATPAQRRLWFLSQVPELHTTYLVPSVLEVTGDRLDVDRLAETLRRVIDRHPALRARFALDADGRQLRYRTDLPAPGVAVVDGSAWSPTIVDQHVREMCRRRFDLAQRAPARAEVIRTRTGALVVLCAHHIVVDGESARVIFAELAETHAALAAGREPALAPPCLPPLPGAVDPARLREVVDSLESAPFDVALPHDRTRPDVQRTTGAGCAVPPADVPADLLQRLARAEGVTPFMVVNAVLAVVLGRVSGQRDFLFASPWSDRDDRTADAVTMLVNTIVVRVDTRDATTWRELLRRVRVSCLAAFRNGDVPFDEVVTALQPERDLSRPPLTPVQVTMADSTPAPPVLGDGLTTRWAPNPHDQTKYELTVDVTVDGGRPSMEVIYPTALFDAGTVVEIAAGLRQGLAELAADIDGLLRMPELERVPPPLSLALGALPGDPDEPAVLYAGEVISRRRLDAQAWGVTRQLIDLGVGPGDMVPVVADRGGPMLAGWLGVLRAGAAYTPVSAEVPADRLAFLIEDTGAKVVVVDEVGARAVDACQADVVTVSLAGPGGTRPSRTAAITASDLALVIYTSGTTGRPKGVQVTHGNLAAYLEAMHGRHPQLPGRRHLLASTTDTDFAITVIYGGLASGGSIVLTTPEQSLDGRALDTLVVEAGVEVAKFTPSHLTTLLGTPFRERVRALPVLILGGEPTFAPLAARLADLRPAGTVTINHYAPTETTVGSFTHLLDGDPTKPPVGTALPGNRYLLLDEAGRPVPRGETGMLWIGGRQVTAGYLNRPEANRAAFRTDPLGRIYRSGDLAFEDEQGQLRIVGRLDDQVKVRGYRVEPSEVAQVLVRLPGVARAQVLGHEGGLAAFVIPDDPAVAPATIREMLQAKLPAHLVPDRIVCIDRMPLARTGKVDRDALRSRLTPVAGGPTVPAVDGGEDVPPDTSTIAEVSKVWTDLLGVEQIRPDQPFFEIGGNSLLLIALLERLRSLTEVRIEAGDLFRSATIQAQVALLQGAEPVPLGGTAVARRDRAGLAARRRRVADRSDNEGAQR